MASGRYTPQPVTSAFDATGINNNFVLIASAINNVLSRYADTPNSMQSNLDMNGYALLNQLNPLELEAFHWVGPWVTATAYSLDDAVFFNSSSYVCISAHTSGTFGADLAADKWQIICQGTTNRNTWVGPGTYYFIGDLITDGSDLYMCIVNNLSTASFPNDLASGWWELYTNFLGTMATQNASAVAITGGTISGISSLGATTATVATDNVTTGNITNMNSSNVAITGGTINATTIGATTAAAATFTTALLTSAITGANQAATKDYVDADFSSGSIALPGGLLLKYGTMTIPLANITSVNQTAFEQYQASAQTISFPVAFPTNCFFVSEPVTTQGPKSGAGYLFGAAGTITAQSVSSFTVVMVGSMEVGIVADQNWVLNWWALGN